MHVCCLLLLLAAWPAVVANAACQIAPSHLTVEYRPSSLADLAEHVRPVAVDHTTSPRLGWWLVPIDPDAKNQSQSAYQIQVSTSASFVAADVLWDSGKVVSAQSVAVAYGGPNIAPFSVLFWRAGVWDQDATWCGWSEETGTWEMAGPWAVGQHGASEADDLATWVTALAPAPPPSDCEQYEDHPAPRFRRVFAVDRGQLARARVYATGLGYFELELDGAKVGDSFLDPAWSSYNVTVYYAVFNVTRALLADDDHALGVTLGNGWFNLLPLRMWGSRNFREALAHGEPLFALQLRLWYHNGTVATVSSDSSWRTGPAPIIRNSIYLGEKYDARAVVPGWSTFSFDDSKWQPSFAAPRATSLGRLRAQVLPPIRRQGPRPARLLREIAGQRVYDVGQNIAGHCDICFTGGVAGQEVTFLYGEVLYPNGLVNGMTSVAGQIKSPGSGGPCAPNIAFQSDTVLLDGHSFCWHQTFTWHGFRFIQVSGQAAAVQNITCYPLRSDVDSIGSFNSSCSLLNAIHALDRATAEANMMSVQSDCPHRERLGYGGDALMSGESFLLNYDMTLFYEKRVQDFVDAQRANGGFTETAPFVDISDAGLGGDSGPIGWQSVAPVLVDWLVRYHGNARLANETYSSLQDFMTLLDSRPAAIETGLGDWMALEPKALAMTGLGFVILDYRAFANISRLLGHDDAAAKYESAADTLADEINHRFFNPATGVYAGGGSSPFNQTQCSQALPLYLQIVPPNAEALAVAALARAIADGKTHLQVGGFAIKWVLAALADHGLEGTAAALLQQTDYPSFGYMMHNENCNATTAWESWFFSDNTYSHNHPMFISSEVYFFNSLAGLQVHPSANAFDHVLVRPRPVPGLMSISASLTTVRGPLSLAWTAAGSHVTVTLSVPPNMRATVLLPGQPVTELGSGSHTLVFSR